MDKEELRRKVKNRMDKLTINELGLSVLADQRGLNSGLLLKDLRVIKESHVYLNCLLQINITPEMLHANVAFLEDFLVRVSKDHNRNNTRLLTRNHIIRPMTNLSNHGAKNKEMLKLTPNLDETIYRKLLSLNEPLIFGDFRRNYKLVKDDKQLQQAIYERVLSNVTECDLATLVSINSQPKRFEKLMKRFTVSNWDKKAK